MKESVRFCVDIRIIQNLYYKIFLFKKNLFYYKILFIMLFLFLSNYIMTWYMLYADEYIMARV
jgi:hypothetical protein